MDLVVKKTYGYRERDEEKRREFKEELAKYSREEQVYIDEAGMDNRTGRETRPVMNMAMDIMR